MTNRYVGAGGNDAWAGTSWGTRKLTLNGVEDTPVAAGDTVYVGPGIYRELLTCDVSGTAGSPITYIGDYAGTNTDGVGGVVRITGSNDDQTATRGNCITSSSKNYRNFQNFVLDGSSNAVMTLTSPSTWTISNIFINHSTGILISGAAQSAVTINNSCFYYPSKADYCIKFTHSSALDNIGHVVSNCIIVDGSIYSDKIGGITVKNSFFSGAGVSYQILALSLNAGQTITVNNNLFTHAAYCLYGGASGMITEDYNNIINCSTPRTNTSTGANSKAIMFLPDPRWFFQLATAGAGPNSTAQVVSPFDLASYSALLNVAGTGPTTTDMRGTAAQGGQREWGALEYDSTLKLKGGGGAVTISPSIGGGL